MRIDFRPPGLGAQMLWKRIPLETTASMLRRHQAGCLHHRSRALWSFTSTPCVAAVTCSAGVVCRVNGCSMVERWADPVGAAPPAATESTSILPVPATNPLAVCSHCRWGTAFWSLVAPVHAVDCLALGALVHLAQVLELLGDLVSFRHCCNESWRCGQSWALTKKSTCKLACTLAADAPQQ